VLEKMPTWVQVWLVEKDGRFGTFGVLYTKLSGSDARQMEALSNRLEQWRHRFAGLRFASPVAQLGEVTPRLRKEASSIVGLALLGVLIATFLVGRSLRRTVTVLLPLVVTMAIALGLMALSQIHVNLYNMLVFPLAFGIGVDGAVYVAWALSSPSEGRLPTAARAVFGSTLTTTAGFGSLMVSSNPGLHSIGMLAVLVLGISLAANLVWLPALAAWRARGKACWN
jgi:predicted RND superfamily exporter protein